MACPEQKSENGYIKNYNMRTLEKEELAYYTHLTVRDLSDNTLDNLAWDLFENN